MLSCQNLQQRDPDKSKKTIVFLGSSVCKGVGDEDMIGYAGRFAMRLDTSKWNYINESIGGDNTIKISKRLDSVLNRSCPDYVVIGLSLSNEGITSPQTSVGQERIFERFRTGLLRIASDIRLHGAVPVIANCYARNTFNDRHYWLTCRMNAIINEWEIPSINLLGTINDGFGKWAKGCDANDGHPNRYGHEEMSRAICPTLFDALDEGKPVPYRNWSSDYIYFSSINDENPALQIKIDTLMHSFSESFMFRATGEGVIGGIKFQQGDVFFEIKNNTFYYNSDAGSLFSPLPDKEMEDWVYVTLSHCHANSETYLYVNGVKVGPLKEKVKPTIFALGGFNGHKMSPDTLVLKDWMIHRSSLTHEEACGYMAWKMLRSSLEVYAPLTDTFFKTDSGFMNLAQSMTKVVLNPNVDLKCKKIGFRKKI